jgi:drug/metabolite transporter (DMT)-like permease
LLEKDTVNMAQAHTGVSGAAQHIATTRAGAWTMLIVGNTIFAGSYVAGKVALRDLSPITLNAFRFSIAALFLLPIVIAGRQRLRFPLRMLPRFAMLVLTGFVVNKLFEYIGLNLTTASDTALLISTESIFTALFSWVILRERFSRTAVLALAIGFPGVYLIIEKGFIPHMDTTGSASLRVLGDLLVILSLAFESGYTVSGKALLDRYPPLLITSASIIGSLFFWLPAGGEEIARLGWPQLSLAGWLGLLYLAIAVTAVGYFLWFQALTRVDASSAAPFLFIQPLLGAVSSILLLGEELTWATIAGGALIVISVSLVSRRKPIMIEPLET